MDVKSIKVRHLAGEHFDASLEEAISSFQLYQQHRLRLKC